MDEKDDVEGGAQQELPGDVGGPEPELETEKTKRRIVAASVIGVTLGGFLLVPAMCPLGHTHGATRSARIVWQERQAEIARAVADAYNAERRDK